jgi:hypothetical protein
MTPPQADGVFENHNKLNSRLSKIPSAGLIVSQNIKI